jgi:hypothetical protein
MKVTPLLVFGLSLLPAPVIAVLKAKWTRDCGRLGAEARLHAVSDLTPTVRIGKAYGRAAGLAAGHLPVEMRVALASSSNGSKMLRQECRAAPSLSAIERQALIARVAKFILVILAAGCPQEPRGALFLNFRYQPSRKAS